MTTQGAQWDSRRIRALITAGDFGGLVKLLRLERGWRQGDLGDAAGYSAPTISRLETGARQATDMPMIRAVARELEIPGRVLAQVLGLAHPQPASVSVTAERRGEEDPMRRRTLLGLGLAVPLHLLADLEAALATVPAADAPLGPGELATRFRTARALFDAGDHPQLVAALPGLLAAAHTAAEDRRPESFTRVAACYDLATEALAKIGRYETSRLTADRSTVYAGLSGSALTRAASVRTLSIVLRHTGHHDLAGRLTLEAAQGVEATGLTTLEQSAMFSQTLATAAYTAAEAGDRAGALELIADAERAARELPETGAARTFTVTPASVTLYKVGVLRLLGDCGAALDAGRNLHPGQFATVERRCRMHTDLARAWWSWGKPEQTVAELLNAARQTPAEVRDRPAIWAIATTLTQRHPRVTGVRELTALMGGHRL